MHYRVSKQLLGRGRGAGARRARSRSARAAGSATRIRTRSSRAGAVPVHARALLVPVLHVDEGREALDAAEDARARPARRGPQRPPVREVRRGARRLDPDDVLRRAPGLVQEQPLLHALQERPLLQGGRQHDRPVGRPAVPAPAARQGPVVLAQEGPAWPMDIALGSDGVPSIVYSSRVGDDDVFRYARFNGTKWVRRASSPTPAAACSATATAGSRSTTPTRTGSC